MSTQVNDFAVTGSSQMVLEDMLIMEKKMQITFSEPLDYSFVVNVVSHLQNCIFGL